MNLYAAIAPLFEYPGMDLLECIDGCLGLCSGETHSLLREFHGRATELGISRLQEVYIETFDFQAETSPYIAHHLFGEEIRRSLFMAELRGRCCECGIAATSEAPDHLANVLRFLGVTSVGEERSELLRACLIPALRHMLQALKPENPYASLLQAILLVSQQESDLIAPTGEIAWTPFYSLSFPTSR